MPVQRTICGQPVRLAMPPRRFQFLFAIILIFAVTTLLYGPPSTADIPSYEDVKEVVKNPQAHLPHLEDLKPSLPDIPSSVEKLNPFGPSAHKPPVQKNSNATSPYGAINWIWDFKWSKPFSSQVAQDADTAVLPPLPERPFIYTYYEAAKGQNKEVAEAESRVVLAWRRAWWAQGFRPMVLSRAEAMRHAQYDFVHRMKLGEVDEAVEREVMRWLAWGSMKGGILADWRALPMAAWDEPFLSFLRKGEYPELSRVDGLQDGICFGDETAVETAIKTAVASPLFKNTTESHDKIVALKDDAGAMVNLLGKDGIHTESKTSAIAYYSPAVISYAYKPIADLLTNITSTQGLDLLATLINSHLHLTFQESFPGGVAVVKPLPEHTTALMYEAIEIAQNLTQCPASPIPKSCPPNRTGCRPCDPSKPPTLTLIPALKNETNVYQIGTVPHPYTLNLLHYMVDTLDQEFMEKEVGTAGQDLWINALTEDVFANLDRHKEIRTDKAIVYFKEVVAAPTTTSSSSFPDLGGIGGNSKSTSLWLTAERVSQADLDWIFGFALPQSAAPDSKPHQPDPASPLTIFPRPVAPVQVPGVEVQHERHVRAEETRLQKAREAIKATDKLWKGVVNMVAQWSKGDAEVWRFARAFSARRRRERKDWEEDERAYAGSEKKSGMGGVSRWSDYLPGLS